MLKNLLFITFIFTTLPAFSAEQPLYGDFEAELRSLEKEELKKEELQMNMADAVTDVISDEVGTGQAAVLKNEDLSQITNQSKEAPDTKKEELSIRTRRVRSR